jgi:hypothetical protein
MSTGRVEVDGLSAIVSKPFDAVMAALEAAIGGPAMSECAGALRGDVPSTKDRVHVVHGV